MWLRILDFISSIKLTLICLSAAMVLVFAGTLAQVQLGTHLVQERYFQSLLVWWPSDTIRGFAIPVFPGGHLLGAVLLVNLFAAHLRRFQLNLRKSGIHFIHGGLILMLAGGLFTDLFSVESQMQISAGETKNYSEDNRTVELAITDETAPDASRMVTVPEARLRRGGIIPLDGFPFQIAIKRYYENSYLQMMDEAGPGAERAADHGEGTQISVSSIPSTTRMNRRDFKSAVIEVAPLSSQAQSAAASTWLVSEALTQPQTLHFAGGSWRLEMRPARYYKPYSITLRKFTHERYPGTEIPKNFASQITLTDPARSVARDVVISMNHPFRYAGETYYQSGFGSDNQSSILQVVRNPGFAAPYIACALISAGLFIQFCIRFIIFMRRENIAK